MLSLNFSELSHAKVCTYEILLEKFQSHQYFEDQELEQQSNQVKIEIQAANYSESAFFYGSSLQNILTEARLPEIILENPSIDSSSWDLDEVESSSETKIQNPDTDPNSWGFTSYNVSLMADEESSAKEDKLEASFNHTEKNNTEELTKTSDESIKAV